MSDLSNVNHTLGTIKKALDNVDAVIERVAETISEAQDNITPPFISEQLERIERIIRRRTEQKKAVDHVVRELQHNASVELGPLDPRMLRALRASYPCCVGAQHDRGCCTFRIFVNNDAYQSHLTPSAQSSLKRKREEHAKELAQRAVLGRRFRVSHSAATFNAPSIIKKAPSNYGETRFVGAGDTKLIVALAPVEIIAANITVGKPAKPKPVEPVYEPDEE